MSSPIPPIQGPPTLPGHTIDNPRSSAATGIDAGCAGPPPEVLDQVAAAGQIGEQLREAGHELRFFPSSDGGRVRIEVHDRDGNTLGTLSPAAALELAAGSPLN
jgi:hypothetical protein